MWMWGKGMGFYQVQWFNSLYTHWQTYQNHAPPWDFWFFLAQANTGPGQQQKHVTNKSMKWSVYHRYADTTALRETAASQQEEAGSVWRICITLMWTARLAAAAAGLLGGCCLQRERRKMAAVIGFSSGVSKSPSSMEMRLFLRDRGRADPSLSLSLFFVCLCSNRPDRGSISMGGGGQVSDPHSSCQTSPFV